MPKMRPIAAKSGPTPGVRSMPESIVANRVCPCAWSPAMTCALVAPAGKLRADGAFEQQVGGCGEDPGGQNAQADADRGEARDQGEQRSIGLESSDQALERALEVLRLLHGCHHGVTGPEGRAAWRARLGASVVSRSSVTRPLPG